MTGDEVICLSAGARDISAPARGRERVFEWKHPARVYYCSTPMDTRSNDRSRAKRCCTRYQCLRSSVRKIVCLCPRVRESQITLENDLSVIFNIPSARALKTILLVLAPLWMHCHTCERVSKGVEYKTKSLREPVSVTWWAKTIVQIRIY